MTDHKNLIDEAELALKAKGGLSNPRAASLVKRLVAALRESK